MSDLGSAAVGAAGALGAAGVGHNPSMDKKKRAASARPSRPGRSRSPDGAPRKHRTTTVDRVAKAPVYIRRGDEPIGVKSNTERIFDYLAQMERVVNDHADIIEAADAEEDFLRDRLDVMG